MTVVLHGIANCDTMRKARAWLDAHGVGHTLHDYRRDGVDAERLRDWSRRLGWERLLNRAGTTFRKLPDDAKRDLDADRALALMAEHPAAIRRPVLTDGDTLLVGFDPERYAAALLDGEHANGS